VPLPEQTTRPGLPVGAKAVIGVLAVVGAISIVRWIVSGLFTLVAITVVVAIAYALLRMALRR
jgi:hypothetical protein